MIPGEKLIIKMWDSLIDKGIGGLIEPWQIRRKSDAKAYSIAKQMLILAQAQADAEKIKDETYQYRNSKLVIKKSNNLESINKKIIHDSLINEVNIGKAILQAEEAIINDTELVLEDSNNKVDGDWLNSWQDYAKNITADNMQQLWGKLLAGEMKSPGSYSLRTLQFIYCLSKKEAEEISHLATYQIEDFIIKNIPLTMNEKLFPYFLKMEEFGIIQGVSGIKLNRQILSTDKLKYINQLQYGKTTILIKHNNPEKILNLEACPLTSLGQELLSLCKFQNNEKYLDKVVKLITKQRFKVCLNNVNI
jgi:hypothetical protein